MIKIVIQDTFLKQMLNILKGFKTICIYNLYDKSNFVAQIRTLEQVLNHELTLKKGMKEFYLIKKYGLNQILI